MTSVSYTLSLTEYFKESIILNRVNVFIGANGTGKTTLLNKLVSESKIHFPNYTNTFFYEAGRIVNFQQQYGQLGEPLANYEQILTHYHNYLNQGLMYRLNAALQLLIIKTEKELLKLTLQVYKANQDYKANKEGANEFMSPRISQMLPIDKVFADFSEFFPDIDLDYDPEKKNFICKRHGKTYSPDSLSHGEKQILAILADIEYWGGMNNVIIVDEPELYLNPVLSCLIWDKIEQKHPNNLYVYATHNLSFMLRPSVENIYALSTRSDTSKAITSIKDFDSADLRLLIGNIPSILASSRVLLTEGKENSIDKRFYSWLLDKRDCIIIPLGSCDKVKEGVKGESVWKEVSTDISLAGIIDRDFKSENQLKKITNDFKCLILKYHEAESYLCHPSIIQKIASTIRTKSQVPSIADIEDRIIDYAKNTKLKITRIRAHARVALPDSLQILDDSFQDIDEVVEIFKIAGSESLKKYSEKIDNIEKDIMEEFTTIDQAIEKRDIDKLLIYCEGKELLRSIMYLTGCQKGRHNEHFKEMFFQHIDASEFPHLIELRKTILKKLDYED